MCIFIEWHLVTLTFDLPCADPEGEPGVRTPLRFVRDGVLCGGLMGRRGGPKVVFILF